MPDLWATVIRLERRVAELEKRLERVELQTPAGNAKYLAQNDSRIGLHHNRGSTEGDTLA